MAVDVTQFHGIFFEESFEGLDAMESGLLALAPGAPDSETINTIFRAAHSIKGGSDGEASGEQTELDKTLLGKIGDPLVHLVRNSLDHGIEDAEQRRAAGKPDTGTLSLHASHQGGNIVSRCMTTAPAWIASASWPGPSSEAWSRRARR